MSVPILDGQTTDVGHGPDEEGSASCPGLSSDVGRSIKRETDERNSDITNATCGPGMDSTMNNQQSSSIAQQKEPHQKIPSLLYNKTDDGRNTRSPFGLENDGQQKQHGACDKNKQHYGNDALNEANQTPEQADRATRGHAATDTTSSSTANDQQHYTKHNLHNGGQATSGERTTEVVSQPQHFKHPNPIDTSVSSRAADSERLDSLSGNQSSIHNKPLATTRHYSTIEMPKSEASNAPRVVKRKTSVFSHSGFMGLHKLDQSAIQQHSIAQTTANVTTKLDQPVETSRETAPLPLKGSESSPRRSNRSDALGSTGSSRASSCDEPTIVSPTKLLASSSLHKHASDLKSSSTSPIQNESCSSSSDSCPINSSSSNDIHRVHKQEGKPSKDEKEDETIMECDAQDELSHSRDRGARDGTASQNDTSDEDNGDDDEEDDDDDNNEVFKNQQQGRVDTDPQSKIPPFESIKTQIKRNSIPNAEDIRKHIEKIISRNEEIIENWNQVSIRSYNSSTAQSSTSSGPSNPVSGNKRPSKRWSTTALCTKSGGIALNQTQGAPLSSTILNQKLTGSSERKRSSIYPARRISHHQRHQDQQIPLFNGNQSHRVISGLQQQQQHLLNQKISTSATSPNCCALSPPQVSLSTPGSPKHVASSLSGIQNFLPNRLNDNAQGMKLDNFLHSLPAAPFQSQETIESAIENLSLKKRDEEQQTQQHVFDSNDGAQAPANDLVMAAILVERQRQQQLLENYLRFRAASDHQETLSHQQPPSVPNHIFDQYQQRRQSHLMLEQQLNLNRLAALENELEQQRQQVAAKLMAESLQNQRTLAAANSDFTAHQMTQQFNDLNVNQQALESQLLNEYLAKLMLSRQESFKMGQPSAILNQAKVPSPQHPAEPFQVSSTSPSRVYLRHGTEMQTQSLDSATPSHRCDACDISFWTRDLLNYHVMTSCSARAGPKPNEPIAFNFNQPNGFDASNLRPAMKSNLQSPTVFVSHDIDQVRPVGPTRRRTYDELNAPSSSGMADYRDLIFKTQHDMHAHQRQHSMSSINVDHHARIEEFQDHGQQHQEQQRSSLVTNKSALIPPKSPHKSRESAELAWQQRLNELSILKQQLLVANGGLLGPSASTLQLHHQHQNHQPQAQPTSTSSVHQESNLPIKKRKISEPNMKY